MATTVALSNNNYHLTNESALASSTGGDCYLPDRSDKFHEQTKDSVKRRASVHSNNSNKFDRADMQRQSNSNLTMDSTSSRTSSSSFCSTASSISSSSSSLSPLTASTAIVHSNGMASLAPPRYCSCASPLTLIDISKNSFEKSRSSLYCDRCQLHTNSSLATSQPPPVISQSGQEKITSPDDSFSNGTIRSQSQKSINGYNSDSREIKRNSMSITNFEDTKLSMKVITNSKGEPLASVVDVSPTENKFQACNRFFKGIGLTVLSALFFSITTVIVKYTKDIKPSQLACFRFIGILLFSFPVALETEKNLFGASDLRVWIILRGIAGATSLFFRYSALTYMSLADTTIIVLSMPVFVFIFARIFLKENFGRYHILALVMSLVGIALASKLAIFFSPSSGNDTNSNSTTTTTTISTLAASIVSTLSPLVAISEPVQNGTDIVITTSSSSSTDPGLGTRNQLYGTLFSLGAMLVGSSVYVLIRKIRSTHHSIILFNFAWVAIIEMLSINYIFYDFHIPTEGWTPWLVTLLAIFSFYGQLLLTKAIQIEEAGVVSVIRVSSEALFAFVFQIVLFKEIPDVYSICGAILVLSSVMLLSFRKYILSLPESSSMRQRFRYLAL